jgi:hypothetical protein
MPRNVDFAGTTAVVTGGASGIGRGMATAFRSVGCNVVIADIDDAELAATAWQLGMLGVRTDVTDPDSVVRGQQGGRAGPDRGARRQVHSGRMRIGARPRIRRSEPCVRRARRDSNPDQKTKRTSTSRAPQPATGHLCAGT